jgi:hypothetical protein
MISLCAYKANILTFRIIILSRILVTETEFGFVNRFTGSNYNYSQLLITLPVVTRFTIIFY